MRLPKSRIGWVFVLIYLAGASFLIYQAFTCSGWVCDLVEVPVAIPFGFLWLILLQWLEPIFVFGSITYAPFTNWFFIVPTLAGNSVICYWLGVGFGMLRIKFLQKTSA